MITHKLEGIEKIAESLEITANKAKYGALESGAGAVRGIRLE